MRLIERAGPWRIDAFAAKPNAQNTGIFDGGWLHGLALWGIYGTHGGPIGCPTPSLEAYYFGTKRPNAPFNNGVTEETRHSVGVHAFRSNTPLAYDTEVVFQFGGFGQRNIRAWSTSTSGSYTFHKPWSPQSGLLVAVNSGGSSERTLGTFYAPFSRGVSLEFSGPSDLTGVEGTLTFKPRRSITIVAGMYSFWRKSQNDGLYAFSGFPELAPTNKNLAVGVQPILVGTWVLSPHLSMHGCL